MQLREALTQISEIRTHMARAQVFRGYRSLTSAASGLVAVLTAAVQPLWVPAPAEHVAQYILLWVAAAAVSLAIVAVEMIVRARRSQSRLQVQLTMLAAEQFTPSLVAGALLTYVLATFAPAAAPLLPGLWMIVFALGVFASCRLLPRATFCTGGFYLIAGLLALVLSTRGWGYSPWLMGVPFGLGQAMTAAILYWHLERRSPDAA